jgi:hypothetical protein
LLKHLALHFPGPVMVCSHITHRDQTVTIIAGIVWDGRVGA